MTFYIDWEVNVRDFYVDLVFKDENNGHIYDPIDFRPSQAGTYSYTFVTPNIDFHFMNVGFCHRGTVTTDGGYLGTAGNVKLTETEKVAIDDLGPQLSKYTTKTEFQQTNEDFTFKIQQAGGYNLIKNSTADGGSAGWLYSYTANQCFMSIANNSNPKIAPNGNMFGYLNLSTTTEQYSYSPRFPLKPNTTYTFSAWIQTQKNVASLDIFVLGSESLEGTSSDQTSYDSKHIYHPVNTVNTGGAWQYVTKTFTTKDGIKSGYVRVDHNGLLMSTDSYVYIHWASLMLTEGSIALPWSPHPSEMYDGIVRIDKSGLTIQHDNNKSVLDSEALNFYAGDVRYSRVKGGRFEFTNSDGNVIGGIGKTTWVGTNTGISSVNATYGHSVSLGAQRGSADENYTSSLTVCSKDGKLSENGGYYFEGLNISTPKVLGIMYIRSSSTDTIDLRNQGMMMYANYGNGYRTGNIFANEELTLGTQYGTENWTGFVVKENGTQNSKNELHAYGPLDMHNYNISRAGWVNPVSATTTYTTRLLNEGSIENMTYGGNTFTEGELRYVHRQTCHTVEEWDYNDEGVWSPLGVYYCYCELPIFMAENIELDYHVNIGKVGWGDYRVIEKNPYLFIVESQEEGFAFTWEVVAKQVEKAKNNVVVANEYVSTGRSQPLPTEDSDFTYELDKEEFIEENNIQENIITGEE